MSKQFCVNSSIKNIFLVPEQIGGRRIAIHGRIQWEQPNREQCNGSFHVPSIRLWIRLCCEWAIILAGQHRASRIWTSGWFLKTTSWVGPLDTKLPSWIRVCVWFWQCLLLLVERTRKTHPAVHYQTAGQGPGSDPAFITLIRLFASLHQLHKENLCSGKKRNKGKSFLQPLGKELGFLTGCVFPWFQSNDVLTYQRSHSIKPWGKELQLCHWLHDFLFKMIFRMSKQWRTDIELALHCFDILKIMFTAWTIWVHNWCRRICKIWILIQMEQGADNPSIWIELSGDHCTKGAQWAPAIPLKISPARQNWQRSAELVLETLFNVPKLCCGDPLISQKSQTNSTKWNSLCLCKTPGYGSHFFKRETNMNWTVGLIKPNTFVIVQLSLFWLSLLNPAILFASKESINTFRWWEY